MSKISIAICTYNGEKYLREQLDSFAAQTRLPDEVVICDDCSQDATRRILKDFAAQSAFPVKLHFNEHNLGFIKNFEQVIKLCEGEIIVLSDQDDVWEPNKLEVIEKEFANPEVGLVYADAAVVDENLNALDKTMWQYVNFTDEKQKEFTGGKAFDLLIRNGYFLGSSMAFRAKFCDLILPIPLDIYYLHDNWIALVISSVARCEIVSELLIKYRQHEQQSSDGLARRSKTETVFVARRRNNDYSGIINQLDIVESRLLKSSYNPASIKTAVAKIKQAKRHLQNRSTLPEAFLRRLPVVARDLFQWHYHRYSNGFYSAVKDLI
jgi:glycosyltransferase involved in cell wall biosynthesis